MAATRIDVEKFNTERMVLAYSKKDWKPLYAAREHCSRWSCCVFYTIFRYILYTIVV